MLVAQSYSHSTMSSKLSRSSRREPTRSQRAKKELSEKIQDNNNGRPKMLSLVTSPTSSKPVVIPTRTSAPKHRTSPERSSAVHDNEALPPSMAALLAIASVQNKPTLSTKRKFVEKLLQKDALSPDDFRFALSSSSPKSWNILQSPPAEEEDEESKESEGDASSVTSGSTAAPMLSYRSLSYDSMPSLDMELDFDSPVAFQPPTPASRLRTKQKKLMSPRSSLGVTDHPLSPPIPYEQDISTPTQEKSFELALPPPRVPTPKSLTSNLTASIRLLKSAARTTLATISPTQYTPNPLPTFPMLSSYSRPSLDLESASTSPAAASSLPLVLANIDAIPFHMTSPLPDLPLASTSIQLLPYSRSTISSSDLATAPPVFLPAAQPSRQTLEQKSLTRPREPRENSDFLRVVVLEMNMRRAGKLNSEGRARIWLSARRDAKVVDSGAEQESRPITDRGVCDILSNHEQKPSAKAVPARWRELLPEE